VYNFASLFRHEVVQISLVYDFAKLLRYAKGMKMDATKILSRAEIKLVLADLQRKRRSVNTRQNAIIFRLACCQGLRVAEIVGLRLTDVKCDLGAKPHLNLPKAITKRRKARKVPLWWDSATLAALSEWKRERIRQGAGLGDPFVCSQSKRTKGKPLARRNAQNRWKAAIKVLGKERQATLSIHCGRHSYCSHALNGGRSLAEVRDSAGHSNISTTNVYLHVGNDDDGKVGNLFGF
jgi:integrase/recombinase XerD